MKNLVSNSAQANSCLLEQGKYSQGCAPLGAWDCCVMGEVPLCSPEVLPGSASCAGGTQLCPSAPPKQSSLTLQTPQAPKTEVQNSKFHFQTIVREYSTWGEQTKAARGHTYIEGFSLAVPHPEQQSPAALEATLSTISSPPNNNPQLLYPAGESLIFTSD